jgi:hypothetical protein
VEHVGERDRSGAQIREYQRMRDRSSAWPGRRPRGRALAWPRRMQERHSVAFALRRQRTPGRRTRQTALWVRAPSWCHDRVTDHRGHPRVPMVRVVCPEVVRLRDDPRPPRARRQLLAAVLAAVMLSTSPVLACPTCAEGIRREVQAGIFDGSFARNLALTTLPFGVLAGICAALHFGLPRRGARRE